MIGKWKIVDALPEEKYYFKTNIYGFHPIDNQATLPVFDL